MNAHTPFSPKSPADVRAELDRKGQSIAEFARANNISKHTVYQVLSGQKKGLRGQSHRAAVALGFKEGDRTP